MAGFKLFGQIEKMEEQEDGTLLVSGVASSEAKDSQGDIIPSETMKAAIPGYMAFGAVREMHQPIAAGTAISLEVRDDGKTYLEALIVDPTSIKKVQTGVLKGFSIGGGIPKDGGRDAKNKKIIRKLNLTEISLVDRPANPEAVITLAKFDTDQEGPMATENQNPETAAGSTEDQPVVKGMWDVKAFAELLQSISSLASCSASEAGWEGDNSPVPEKLRGWLTQGGTIFQEMAAEEVAELIASLNKQMGVPETIVAAAKAAGQAEGEDAVAKAGAKYSKTTKAAIKSLREAMTKAAECMKAFDDMPDDEEAEGEAGEEGATEKVAKAELVEAQETLAKVQAENADLTERLAKAEANLEELNAGAKVLLAKLQTKGGLKVVPVEKAADNGGETKTEKATKEEAKEAEPTTALEAIRKVHAAGPRKSTLTSR